MANGMDELKPRVPVDIFHEKHFPEMLRAAHAAQIVATANGIQTDISNLRERLLLLAMLIRPQLHSGTTKLTVDSEALATELGQLVRIAREIGQGIELETLNASSNGKDR